MNSRTFEFDYGSYVVEVEATKAGHVIEAKMTVDHMEPIDCTDRFRNSDWCMKELWKRILDTDWSDSGDDDFSMEPLEQIKSALRPA